MLILLDSTNETMIITNITLKKKEEREIFIILNGINILIDIIELFINEKETKNGNTNHIHRRNTVINEILLLLRELCSSIPNLSNQYCHDIFIASLFKLLHYDTLFDSTMSLLEEILSVRVETFCLSLIENFYELINKLTSRRLAHFCRVLALVLFEPEDRIIMENSQTLRSYELLTLRRERMNKISSIEIERNQCIIIEMPDLLKKLVTLLKLSNYGPSIAELLQNNFAMPNELTTEFILHLSPTRNHNEWLHLQQLEELAQQPSRNITSASSSSLNRRNYNNRTNQQQSQSQLQPQQQRRRISTDDRFFLSSLTGFTGDSLFDDDSDDFADYNDIFNSNQFDEFSLFSPGNLEESAPPPTSSSSSSSSSSLDNTSYLSAFSSRGNHSNMERNLLDLMRVMRAGNHTPQQALNELQFQALSLASHQVELLFVLCTLLSGRRKVEVQIRFAELGLADILQKMFVRLSWDTPSESLHYGSEHLHGQNCECNPVSALRVQYLRLVHNFFDRDFHNNANKTHVISIHEKKILSKYNKQILYQNSLYELLHEYPDKSLILQQVLENQVVIPDISLLLDQLPTNQCGILTNIMKILKGQKSDSVYRFWLTSCLESYVRGLGFVEQKFTSSFNVLTHLIDHICHDYHSNPAASILSILSTSTLQSSYDLLGELIKFNFPIIEQFEDILLKKGLINDFFTTLSNHLIDSNVFLRSLFVTFDSYHEKYQHYLQQKRNYHKHNNNNNNNNNENIDFSNFSLMSKQYYRLPPSCLHKNVLYESLSTGIKEISNKEPKREFNLDIPSNTLFESFPIAHVGYLSHSWIHFQPEIISTEAVYQYKQLEDLKLQQYNEKIGNKRNQITSSFSSRSTPKSGFKNGNMSSKFSESKSNNRYNGHNNNNNNNKSNNNKISNQNGKLSNSTSLGSALNIQNTFLNLQGFTNMFLNPTTNDNTTSQIQQSNYNQESDSKPSSNSYFLYSSFSSKDAETRLAELLELEVQREKRLKACMGVISNDTVMNVDVGNSNSGNYNSDNYNNICDSDFIIENNDHNSSNSSDSTQEIKEKHEQQEEKEEQQEQEQQDDMGDVFEWKLPGSVKYLSSYLEQQKEHILFGLMSIVSLRSINHENICCINTSILIFIYAHKRNKIPKLITGVKYLSKSNNQIITNSESNESNVLVNFRELLWYWNEYYTRRGRDRLSLEYSTHFPFYKWKEIVDLLCQDNGSPCSLLQHPINLPVSPYLDIISNPFRESKSSQSF